MYKRVVKNYIDDKPRYLTDPESSFVKVIKYTDYKAMSVKMVQDVLRNQHIVITDYPIELIVPTDTVEFDEAGLQLLKNLEAHIQFQGQYFHSRL
jgi:alpha-D-ribose 1-methylphosphonate 5-phosphate C-P lyase